MFMNFCLKQTLILDYVIKSETECGELQSLLNLQKFPLDSMHSQI